MFESYSSVSKDILVIVVTLGVSAAFLYMYFIVRPTIVLSPDAAVSGCPDRWREINGECVPQYDTPCMPYRPELYKGQECEIAKACGTSFKGLCY